jgi:hypothetical protein
VYRRQQTINESGNNKKRRRKLEEEEEGKLRLDPNGRMKEIARQFLDEYVEHLSSCSTQCSIHHS